MLDASLKTPRDIGYEKQPAGASVVVRFAKVGIFTAIISTLGTLIGFFNTSIGTRKSSVRSATSKNLINETDTTGDCGGN